MIKDRRIYSYGLFFSYFIFRISVTLFLIANCFINKDTSKDLELNRTFVILK